MPANSDTITLRGISAHGHHGVLAHEREDGQRFVVDLELGVDHTRAARSDQLEHTVNYAEVATDTVAEIEGPACDLIEHLAGRIADRALRHTLVESVVVRVHKPQAPIPTEFSDVSVTLTRTRDTAAVVALGANVGEAAATLQAAARDVADLEGVHRLQLSRLFDTDPVGGPEQPPFVNAVAVLRTSLSPPHLLALLHEIEAAYGRQRQVRWGPRTLDLDLIQWGTPGEDDEWRSAEEDLQVPHPRAAERPFVLVPWLDLDPEAVLRGPEGVRSVADVLATLPPAGIAPRSERP